MVYSEMSPTELDIVFQESGLPAMIEAAQKTEDETIRTAINGEIDYDIEGISQQYTLSDADRRRLLVKVIVSEGFKNDDRVKRWQDGIHDETAGMLNDFETRNLSFSDSSQPIELIVETHYLDKPTPTADLFDQDADVDIEEFEPESASEEAWFNEGLSAKELEKLGQESKPMPASRSRRNLSVRMLGKIHMDVYRGHKRVSRPATPTHPSESVEPDMQEPIEAILMDDETGIPRPVIAPLPWHGINDRDKDVNTRPGGDKKFFSRASVMAGTLGIKTSIKVNNAIEFVGRKISEYRDHRAGLESKNYKAHRAVDIAIGGIIIGGLSAVAVYAGKYSLDSFGDLANEGVEATTRRSGRSDPNPLNHIQSFSGPKAPKSGGTSPLFEEAARSISKPQPPVVPKTPSIPVNYEYPWNWAESVAGKGRGSQLILDLGQRAQAAGHNVVWEGQVLNVDGHYGTDEIVHILSQYSH